MEGTTLSKIQPFLMPLAVVLAGGLVAGAVIFKGGSAPVAQKGGPQAAPTQQPPQKQEDTTSAIAKVTEKDHIKGSVNAPIKIVEYSDFECPFCKQFHDTMNSVMNKYKDGGEVAWVFRQMPLESLHPVKAQAVAVASECAADQGGDSMFWKFADRYFALTLTNNRTDIDTVIPQIAREIGLSEAAFAACRTSGKFDAHIQEDVADAIATGGRGTPWSVVITASGKTFALNGAQSAAAVEQAIERARKE